MSGCISRSHMFAVFLSFIANNKVSACMPPHTSGAAGDKVTLAKVDQACQLYDLDLGLSQTGSGVTVGSTHPSKCSACLIKDGTQPQTQLNSWPEKRRTSAGVFICRLRLYVVSVLY